MKLLRPIKNSEKRVYLEDGIVCLRGLFSKSWIELLQETAQQCLNTPGELHVELAKKNKDDGRFFHDTFMWISNPRCESYVFKSPAAFIARQILNSEKINIFFDQWLIKEPGTWTKTPWHHDMTYWPIDGNQICTLWLALDEVDANSGAVEYVKGSHRWGQKFRAVSFSGNSQYTEALPEIPDIESVRDELEIVQFELEPGDCTIHHGLTIHGSPGNLSQEKRRRAHVSRWIGDDIIFNPRQGLQEMPPLPDLNPGDPLDSALWPRII